MIEKLFWYNDDNSDKLWGIARHNDATYTFWCRRNMTVKVKFLGNIPWHERKLIRNKQDKGYTPVNKHQQLLIDPDLDQRLQQAIVLSSLRA